MGIKVLSCILISLTISSISTLASSLPIKRNEVLLQRFFNHNDWKEEKKQAGEQAPIMSRIIFRDHYVPEIIFADISIPDPITKCPSDDASQSLRETLSSLVAKVKSSIEAIDASRTKNCKVLQDRLDSSHATLDKALQAQAASASNSSNTSQTSINLTAMQASAMSEIVSTTSILSQEGCIKDISKAVAVQKVVGQVLTIGGLFYGGWPGIGIAAGGQIFANLPLFEDQIDEAMRVIREYESHNLKDSFLCLFRKMLTTNSNLFSKKNSRFILGFDMDFEEGDVRTTKDTLLKLELIYPEVLHDVKVLATLHKDLKSLHEKLLENQDTKSLIPHTESFYHFCLQHEMTLLKSSDVLPTHIQKAYDSLKQKCDNIKDAGQSLQRGRYQHYVHAIFQDISNLRHYYEYLKTAPSLYKNDDEEMTKNTLNFVTKTSECMGYFEGVRQSYMDATAQGSGNQLKIRFLNLVERLGNSLVQEILDDLISNNTGFITKQSRTHKRLYNDEIRSTALRSMLDACQLLDPTLVALYPDYMTAKKLQSRWINSCVGPSSRICQSVGANDRYTLLKEWPPYATYLASLCGPSPLLEHKAMPLQNPLVDFTRSPNRFGKTLAAPYHQRTVNAWSR